jgi:drug/metabolite transporter (DMT)-like permease
MFSRNTQILLAFATVYLVWGSTYLAIRVGVQELPPVLFVGVRFDLAGVLMLAFALARGHALPRRREDWFRVAATGLIMLACANGLVTWSEQWVESNQAALIVATSALWMAWLGTLGRAGERLSSLTVAGLLLGFAGVGVLVGGGLSLQAAPLTAYLALIVSPVLWACGSVYSRRHPGACSPLMTAALQMCFTGVFMTLLGLALGETSEWRHDSEAYAALAYLIVFGSCLGYGAYFWLVHEVSPAALGTYAYVNPAVAVLLGWWLLDERLSATQMAGTAVILAGVVLVSWSAHARSRKLAAQPAPAAAAASAEGTGRS